MLSNTEAVLTPNIGNRMEDFLFDKMEKKKPNRYSNLEYLGIDMIKAGNDFGAGTAYGKWFISIIEVAAQLRILIFTRIFLCLVY